MLGGGSVKAGAGSDVGAITLFEQGYPDGMEVASADQHWLLADIYIFWRRHGGTLYILMVALFARSADPSLLLTQALIPHCCSVALTALIRRGSIAAPLR